jgi:tRNA G37 N-methylase Trm5
LPRFLFYRGKKYVIIPFSKFLSLLEEALRRLLPQEITVPTGHETIGHVIHLNLTEEQLPYKTIIGQVLLEV